MNADKTNYDLLYNRGSWSRTIKKSSIAGKTLGAGPRHLDCYLDVPYGSSEAEKMDIFRAQGKSEGS